MRSLHQLFTPWLMTVTVAAGAVEIDGNTGLIIAPGFEAVSVQCTVCHSARLISQSRADYNGWLAMIRWMQDTQGLWLLADQEQVILDYLAANYGPTVTGRRRPLALELLPPQGR